MEDIKMTATKAPYAKLKPALDAAFSAVMAQMDFEDGPQVQSFVRSLETYFQAPYALPCTDGVEALKASLRLLQLPAQAEIIVPAFGDAMLVTVLLQLGLKPVIADVDLDTYTVTAATVAKVITSQTKGVVVSHLFGQGAAVFEIRALCQTYNSWLIEDASQALGAVYTAPDGKKHRAGAVGDVGITNFYPTKPALDSGEGAAVLVNNAALAATVEQMQVQGILGEQVYRSRLGTLQAAMMEVKLPFVEEYNAARQEVAHFYDSAFRGIAGVQVPQQTSDRCHTYQQYTITVAPELRDGLQQHLYENYIPSAVFYAQPLHQTFPSLTFNNSQQLSGAAKAAKSTLSLPLHSELKEEQLAYICQNVVNYVKQNV
ncbi:DegT/DnrJ/EryC1/StrS family aminotransferase [Pontibacter rugosus]|uniref:DegT/DnrJ/EryC1/StrS family aminotransferase n=1 Tax=Pontibacter rugosus TaxID=1745966 RepID=A0ABW3SQ76_9BACT